MGNILSKGGTQLRTQWRKIPTDSLEPSLMANDFLGRIENFEIHQGVPFLNILLFGQAASGKSSFVNTCATALQGRDVMITPATVLGGASASCTACLEAFPLKKRNGKFLNIRLFDCRGLSNLNGIHDEDIHHICKGEIKNGYKFNPTTPIQSSDEKFCKEPDLKNSIHCVVYVVGADNPPELLTDEKTAEQLRAIRDMISPLNIPQIVLINKVDLLGINDLTTILQNSSIKQACECAARFLSIPEGNVLPMSNYTTELVKDDTKNFLALFNLWMMMEKANQFVTFKSDAPEEFYD